MNGNALWLTLISGAAIALLFFWQFGSARAEAQETFGDVKAFTCQGERCRYFTPPQEIAAITRGLYTEFVGLSINDGIAAWHGVDLDRHELVRVERYAGPRLGSAPRVETPTADRYSRETTGDNGRWIDVVTRRPLALEHQSRLIALANVLWRAEPGLPRPPMDVHHALVLLDGTTLKVIGPAFLTGEAETIRVLVEGQFVAPARVQP